MSHHGHSHAHGDHGHSHSHGGHSHEEEEEEDHHSHHHAVVHEDDEEDHGHSHAHGGHGSHGGHGHSHAPGEACSEDEEDDDYDEEHGHSHAHGGHGGHGHSHGDDDDELYYDDHGDDHGHSHDGDDHGHSHDGGGHGHSHGAPQKPRFDVQAYMSDIVCRHKSHTNADSSDTVDENPLVAAIKAKNEAVMLNPSFPFAFETIGNGPVDAEYDAQQRPEIGLLLKEDDLSKVAPDQFSRPSIHEALLLAYTAPTNDPAKAREIAEKALTIDAVCPAAYFVLGAVCAKDLAEAEQYFDKAISVGNIGDYCPNFQTIFEEGHMWSHVHMRCYFRAVYGRFSIMRKKGNYESAIKLGQLLELLEHRRPALSKCLINYRLYMPELYLRLGKYVEAIQYIRNNPVEVDMRLSRGCGPFWSWCELLGEYAALFKAKSVCVVGSSGKSRAFMTCMQFPQLLPYMTGEKELPGNHAQWEVYADAEHVINQKLSKSEYLGVFTSLVGLWQSVEGAIPWLLKNVHTFLALMLFQGEQAVKRFAPHFPELVAPNALENILKKGVFPNAGVNGPFALMHVVVLSEEPNAADLIKLLLQQGGDPLIANGDRPITPLHLACYYGSDVEVAKALIDAGGIVTPIGGKPRGSIEVNSPLEMAADQGNYKVIEYVLTTKKGLQAQDKANFPKLLSLLASHVATTSVPDCVSKKGPKCSRCAGNDHPHSPDTNFDKLIEVLFKAGLKISDLDKLLAKAPIITSHPYYAAAMTEEMKKLKLIPSAAASGCSNLACTTVKTATLQLLKCSRCGKVSYCSKECQKADWSMHKKTCIAK